MPGTNCEISQVENKYALYFEFSNQTARVSVLLMTVGNCVYCTGVTFRDNNVYTFRKARRIRNLIKKYYLYMLHENKRNYFLKIDKKIHRI
jgi:hypothetical protein